jgi:hypothetical protein
MNKATLSSYEKNAVNAAFPPYSDRIFKMRKCVALCFWKLKSQRDHRLAAGSRQQSAHISSVHFIKPNWRGGD